MNRRLNAAVAAVLLPFLAAGGAEAAESTYTPIDLAACAATPPDPDDPLASGVWTCPGYRDMSVWVAEGDLRFFVSYGAMAADEPAATQTLPNFNHIGQTLEWRLEEGGGRAFATILRYFVDRDGEREGQVLVVTRLGEGGSICHVAYVDALANPNPNELARHAADTFAPDFRCGEDEVIIVGLRENF